MDRVNERVKMRVASIFSEPVLSLLGDNYSQREKKGLTRVKLGGSQSSNT